MMQTGNKEVFPVILTFFMSLVLIFFNPAVSQGQITSDFRLFSAEMGKMKSSLSYQAMGYTTETLKDQSSRDFTMTRHDAIIVHPISQNSFNEWSVSSNLHVQDIRTNTILPTTGKPFPSDLWDLRFGTQYRQLLVNGWIGGGTLSVGSASNKPFYSVDEVTISANVFTRIPDSGKNAWVILLNYNNNREYLPHVPIPGVGYWYEPSSLYRIAVGIPFLFAEVNLMDDLTLRFNWLPIETVHAGLTYRLLKLLKLYGSFDWRNDRYFMAERTDKDKRFFYYEKRLTIGLQWDLTESILLDVSGGYAFDRFYFEGEKYSDRDLNRVDIKDGPFGALRIGLRY